VPVKLISYTPNALDLLLRTKGTRLKHESDPATWTPEKKLEHLAYMRDTIKSSWEFVDYVFEFTNVTRAFAQQLTRTRAGSYAMETQRAVDVSDNAVVMPENIVIEDDRRKLWMNAVAYIKGVYRSLVGAGVHVQDARGILPMNMTTSIVAKFNLKNLHEMGLVRLCTRTQGEYQDEFRDMRACVIDVHPWALQHQFIEVKCVSEGVCAFPRYGRKECKFFRPWMDRSVEQAELHKVFWAGERQVAVPVAREGRTM
jgi:thymidylate synthase ThyX